jgi:outer membrane immunogenic protein
MRHQPVLAIPPIFSWTGFYIGANLGGAVGSSTVKQYSSNPLAYPYAKWPAPSAGIIGGLQGGYNYQMNWALIGAEVDFDWSNVTSARAYSIDVQSSQFKTNYVGTVRARLGYVMDRALMYITGGYAYSGIKGNYAYAPDADDATRTAIGTPLYTNQKKKTYGGWSLGGGLEYAAWDNILIRAEYLYAGFSKSRYNPFGGVAIGPLTSGMTTSNNLSIMRAGVSYKF